MNSIMNMIDVRTLTPNRPNSIGKKIPVIAVIQRLPYK